MGSSIQYHLQKLKIKKKKRERTYGQPVKVWAVGDIQEQDLEVPVPLKDKAQTKARRNTVYNF